MEQIEEVYCSRRGSAAVGQRGFTLNTTQRLLSPRSKDSHTLSSSSCLSPASMGGTGRVPQAKNVHPTSDPLRRDIHLIASPDNSSHSIKMGGKKGKRWAFRTVKPESSLSGDSGVLISADSARLLQPCDPHLEEGTLRMAFDGDLKTWGARWDSASTEVWSMIPTRFPGSSLLAWPGLAP